MTAVTVRLASPGLAERMLAASTWRAGYVRPDQTLPDAILAMIWHTLESLYGRLGWQYIDVPSAPLATALGLLAVAAGLIALRRQPGPVRRGMLAAAVIALIALVAHVKSGMADPQPQGRLLFPALVAVVMLAAQGLWSVTPRRARLPALAAVTLGLGVVNIHATGSLLPSAYRASTGPEPQVDMRVVPQRQDVRWIGSTGSDRLWQTFRAGAPNLSRIEVAVADAVGTGDLVFTLEDSTGQVIVRRREDLTALRPGWYGFDFGPLPDSAGRVYTLELRFEGGAASDEASDGGAAPDRPTTTARLGAAAPGEDRRVSGGGWVAVYVALGEAAPPGFSLSWPGGSSGHLAMVTYLGEQTPKHVR